jgi:cbb3-type cytochrome oxidase maturation protein
MIAVGAYVWSARGGQFDDLDTPAVRMLHDDEGQKQTRQTHPARPEDST